jgi:hypothetical protein
LEYWKNLIGHENVELKSGYSNTVITVGGGYVWKFYQHIYLNPWIAIHYSPFGDKEVEVGPYKYQPTRILPELSLKIGWHF